MDVMEWLLDADPSIRWQVMRDLAHSPAEAIAGERARVAAEGWGAELLRLQDEVGQWDGGTYRPGWVDESRPFFDAWTATHFTLETLRDLGLDPESSEARRAIALVRDGSRWEATGTRYFQGETEPCINGTAAATGSYFGEDVGGIVDRLLRDQLPDGGWNCWAEYGARVSSFHTTLCAVDGLLAHELAGGGSARVRQARRRGEEYLLERRLHRRRSNGGEVDPRFTLLSFPTRWYYDVLRALDHFRLAAGVDGGGADPRCEEAVALVVARRSEDGRWPLDNVHMGPTLIEMESGEGWPSRWITLRALRVLRWWEGR